ncbi:MAG: hypothetical protein J7L35_00975, partial [Anaerolineales bacterium]|nr:hypothetical protein [Anaerolineales bacterium]
VQVPSALITALNGLVVVFVVSSEIWRRRRQKRRLAAASPDGEGIIPVRTDQGDTSSKEKEVEL